MNYLIIYKREVYYTSVFDMKQYRNGMTVVNMKANKYTSDGQLWWEIEEDTL